MIIIFICMDLLYYLRSFCIYLQELKMAKATPKLFPRRKFSLQTVIFTILMHCLYGYHRNFKFRRISTIRPVFPDYLSVCYDCALLVNLCVTLCWLLSILCTLFRRKQPLNDLCKVLVKDELQFLVNLENKGLRLYQNGLFYRYFTRIVPRFYLTLHFLLIFSERLFYRKPFSNSW